MPNINTFVSAANKLDQAGRYAEADAVDAMLKRMTRKSGFWEDEAARMHPEGMNPKKFWEEEAKRVHPEGMNPKKFWEEEEAKLRPGAKDLQPPVAAVAKDESGDDYWAAKAKEMHPEGMNPEKFWADQQAAMHPEGLTSSDADAFWKKETAKRHPEWLTKEPSTTDQDAYWNEQARLMAERKKNEQTLTQMV